MTPTPTPSPTASSPSTTRWALPSTSIFFDPSDRDAGYYQAQRGDGGAHWWDESDFQRFRDFVGRLVDDTGRKAMLWQVPVGNTLYRSVNNSWGHYQDNRAQYWLGDRAHLQELVDYGVIGLLFGAGADGCTMYTDQTGDGVTNPAPDRRQRLAGPSTPTTTAATCV